MVGILYSVWIFYPLLFSKHCKRYGCWKLCILPNVHLQGLANTGMSSVVVATDIHMISLDWCIISGFNSKYLQIPVDVAKKTQIINSKMHNIHQNHFKIQPLTSNVRFLAVIWFQLPIRIQIYHSSTILFSISHWYYLVLPLCWSILAKKKNFVHLESSS